MAQAQEPNDKNYEVERQLRSLNRRLERLEDMRKLIILKIKLIGFNRILKSFVMRLTKN